MEYVLRTPISEQEVRMLRVGDLITVDGLVVTLRDAGHKRAIEYLKSGRRLPIDLSGLILYHMGPVVRMGERGWEIVSAGPTTSTRLEQYESDLIKKTGVRLIVGKGGMGAKTAEACKRFGAAYAIYPGGAGALAAEAIESVEKVEWLDLGIPEAMWILRVRGFGPLMITIDSTGRDFYGERRGAIEENMKRMLESGGLWR